MLERNSINAHSKTRPQLTLEKWESAGRIGDLGNFLNGLAKSPRVLRSSWIVNEYNFQILHSVRGLYDKNSAS